MAEPARLLFDNASPRAEVAQLELVATPAEASAPREPEQLPLLRMLEIVKERVDSIHASQRTLQEQLRDIKTSLPMQRRPPTPRTVAIHVKATLLRRNGVCPACSEISVCDANGRLPGSEVDHFYARDKAKVQDVWIVCARCNDRLRDTDFHAAVTPAFLAYQAAVKLMTASRQVTMELAAKGE